MRRIILLSFGLVAPLALNSCQTSDLSFHDKLELQSVSMSFSSQGADLAECGLVSQFERGRASATTAGGSGCSACAQ